MGTVAPNPYYTDEMARVCMDTIFLPTMHAMNAEGRTFKGCLYFGLMLTEQGPKVIEYNCRFGDPETQVVLPLLESDLLTIMEATAKGTLAETEVKFSDKHACCLVLASDGYPEALRDRLTHHHPRDGPGRASVYRGRGQAGGRAAAQNRRRPGPGRHRYRRTPCRRPLTRPTQAAGPGHLRQNAYCRTDIGARALAAREEEVK